MKVNISRKVVHVLGWLFLLVLIVLLAYDILRKGIFSNKMGLNIVVVGDNSVSLLLLRPDEEMVSWIDLPKGLKIKIYNSNASYPLVSLWKYGVGERKPFEVIEKSLGLAMGATIARTIKVEGEPSVEGVLANLRQLNPKTDLSLRDRFLVRQFLIESNTSKKLLELIIPKKAFDLITEPDGKEFLVFNSTANLWVKNKFVFEPILGENVDVSINNMTGQTGLGMLVSRQLESTGLRVIEVRAEINKDVAGAGCTFSSWKQSLVTERFLIDQMNCRKEKYTGGDDGDSIVRVWLK